MSQFTITWTPGGGSNVVSQTVNYRKYQGPTGQHLSWVVGASGLNPTDNSAIITAVLDSNQIYEFQVVDICTLGGPQPSTSKTAIKFTCPAVTITKTSTEIIATFPDLGNSIDKYVVKLYNAAGTQELQSHTKLPPFAVNVQDTFSGLLPSTTYKVRVEVYADTFKKLDCGLFSGATNATPACTSPTNLNVIMT